MKELLKDKKLKNDPHKCVIIWSSKVYRNINGILRLKQTIEHLDQKQYKYIKRFLDEFLIYFRTHGIYKEDLIRQKCKKLFRGYKHVVTSQVFNDFAFISTSKRKDVAQSFKNEKGMLVSFSTQNLPDVPFVVIDNTIRDYMLEDEVLMLPGSVELSSHQDKNNGIYRVNQSVYTYMMNLQEGGGRENNDDLLSKIVIPNIDLKGKYVVFWRGVVGRPIDILGIIRLPKQSHKQVVKFWKEVIDKQDREFESMNYYIPRYMDLFEKRNRTEQEMEEICSYTVYIAIYDKKRNIIEHYHYGIFDVLAMETGYNPSRESEVAEKIKNCHAFRR